MRVAVLWAAGLVIQTLPVLADVVITQELTPDTTPKIDGLASEARTAYSPASTFKMIIALAAFEQGVATPETKELCNDKHLKLRPMRLNFQQAMFYSSNDFFVKVMENLTNEEIAGMAEKCGFGEPKGKMPENKSDWRYGATFRVTPLQEAAFLRKLAFGQLPASKSAQKNLVRVMKWPSEVEGVTVYAKTGSWERTYWMVGLAAYPTADGQVFQSIVVTLKDRGSNRDKAIKRFWQAVKEGKKQYATRS